MRRIVNLCLWVVIFFVGQVKVSAVVSEVTKNVIDQVKEETVDCMNFVVLNKEDSERKKNPKPDYVKWDDLKALLYEESFVSGRRKEGRLIFAGDLRTRWIYSKEQYKDPVNDKLDIVPTNLYRLDFNMMIDYSTDRSWLSSKMQWVSFAGPENVGSGVNIDRALIGYHFYDLTDKKFFIEIGRATLDNLFESELEFDSTFDGIHLYYSSPLPGKRQGEVVVHGGPFVVEMKSGHYAWVVEAAAQKLPGDITVKGSLIDWHNFTQATVKYEFLVGQVLLGHTRKVTFKSKTMPLKLSAAALKNFLARATPTSQNKKQDLGYYVGFSLGSASQPRDFLISARYEYLQALAVPENDVSGIGHGNNMKFFFYEAIGSGADPALANGFANYKGIDVSLAYCISPGFLFRGKFDFTVPAVAGLGAAFDYKRCELGLNAVF